MAWEISLNDIDRERLGALFRSARVEQDLKTATVKRRLGVTRQAISSFETGEINGLDRIARYADAYDLNVRLIIEPTEEGTTDE